MPPKEKKSKAQIAKAAASGGKAKKKKWNKGKAKEKSNNAVYFDEANYEKLLAEVPNQKLITVSTIADKLKINGSLARKALSELRAKGLVKPIEHHHAQLIYTRAKQKHCVMI